MKVNQILLMTSALMIISVVSCTTDKTSEPDQTNQEQSGNVDNNGDSSADEKIFYPYTEIELGGDTRAAVDLNNEFAFTIFNKAIRPNENVVMSPFSIFCTLGMLANGDDSECREEIMTLISGKASDSGLATINRYAQTMISELPKVDLNSKCSTYNSLWCTESHAFKSEFANALSENYMAEMFNINPDVEEGWLSINNWIESKTDGYIKNFIDPGTDIKYAVINTLFLKAGWFDFKFDKELTAVETFFNVDKSKSSVEMMHHTLSNGYLCNKDFRGVDIPLGNGNYSITLILPESSDANTTIDAAAFESLLTSCKSCEIRLSLPKFKTEYKEDIRTYLQVLGLNKTLNTGLNSILSNGQLFKINLFMHGVNLTVDEDGLVGASATAAGFATDPGTDTVPDIVELKFNRPFFYIIRETSTNTILFMGRQIKF